MAPGIVRQVVNIGYGSIVPVSVGLAMKGSEARWIVFSPKVEKSIDFLAGKPSCQHFLFQFGKISTKGVSVAMHTYLSDLGSG
jgi:hypothetical protein